MKYHWNRIYHCVLLSLLRSILFFPMYGKTVHKEWSRHCSSKDSSYSECRSITHLKFQNQDDNSQVPCWGAAGDSLRCESSCEHLYVKKQIWQLLIIVCWMEEIWYNNCLIKRTFFIKITRKSYFQQYGWIYKHFNKNCIFPPETFYVSGFFLYLQFYYVRNFTSRWHCVTSYYKDSGQVPLASTNDNW